MEGRDALATRVASAAVIAIADRSFDWRRPSRAEPSRTPLHDRPARSGPDCILNQQQLESWVTLRRTSPVTRRTIQDNRRARIDRSRSIAAGAVRVGRVIRVIMPDPRDASPTRGRPDRIGCSQYSM